MSLTRKIAAMFALFATMSILLVIPPANAAGDEYIWTRDYSSEVKMRLLDGTGNLSTVTSGIGNGAGLYAYGSNVYATYGYVKRFSVDGTGMTTLKTLADLMSVVSDGTYLYYGFEYAQKIGRMNMDGSGANDSWVNFSGITGLNSGWMTIHSGTLYFGGGANTTSKKIASLPTTGGTPTVLYTDASSVTGVTTDGTYLYWTHWNSGAVGRSLLNGTSASASFISGFGSDVWGLVYWNSYLYINNGSFIGRVRSDGTSVQASWLASGGSRGITITGAQTVATTLASYSLSASPVQGGISSVTATFSAAGKVTFIANGKKIPNCVKINTNATSPFTATCNWKPAIQGSQRISVSIVPTSASNLALTSTLGSTRVIARKTTR
jgi:hypothetical protein